jgi:adenine-specific DNA-methyltransferase
LVTPRRFIPHFHTLACKRLQNTAGPCNWRLPGKKRERSEWQRRLEKKSVSDGTASTRRYEHRQEATARPEIGAAPRFKAKAPPVTYRYDSSLAPALDWDTTPARETAAFLLRCI